MSIIHLPKKFQTHNFSDLDPSGENKKFHCTCSEKRFLSHICKTCQFAICSYCLKFYHEKHEVTPIEEFHQSFKEPPQTKLKFLSETINNLTKLTTSSNEKLNQIIDGIIFELQNLKKINAEKNLEFIKENEIIQSFLILLFLMVFSLFSSPEGVLSVINSQGTH